MDLDVTIATSFVFEIAFTVITSEFDLIEAGHGDEGSSNNNNKLSGWVMKTSISRQSKLMGERKTWTKLMRVKLNFRGTNLKLR